MEEWSIPALPAIAARGSGRISRLASDAAGTDGMEPSAELSVTGQWRLKRPYDQGLQAVQQLFELAMGNG
jgi:hypothetical protein